MAARQNANANASGNFQRKSNSSHPAGHSSKSSHPAGHFRDKTKYNNRNGRFAVGRGDAMGGGQQQQSHNTYISQEELTEHLTAKLRGNKFVEVKTKEMKNDRGTLYEIDVINPGLYHIGNGTFFTMKLHTVSHKSRVIFIRIIFNDDETRNADMRINADAIIQIFREIAPDTIESVSLTDVDDSKGNKHLAVLASTVKGASLNYTYERAMEFVHVVDEKYGSSGDDDATASGGDSATAASVEDMSADQIDAEAALLEKKLKALQELKLAKTSGQPAQSSEDGGAATTPEATQVQTQEPQRARKPSRVSITVGGKTHTINNGDSKS
jgi:hypothetical protein